MPALRFNEAGKEILHLRSGRGREAIVRTEVRWRKWLRRRVQLPLTLFCVSRKPAGRWRGSLRRLSASSADLQNVDASQVLHRPISSAGHELIQFGSAGGHRERFCPDEFAAAHIEGGITDDKDFLRLQARPQHTTASFQGRHRNVIAVLMIVGEAAKLESLPETILAQLDFSAKLDIAGEQAEDRWLRQGC